MFEGRIGVNSAKKAAEIYWSGSSINLNFKGTSAEIILEDENGTNFFNVFIDGKFSKVLKLKKGLKTYKLTKKNTNRTHSITLTKRNEWTYGKTLFYGFKIQGTAIKPNNNKNLFIEFYGDSITTGHGNEDYTGEDKPDGNVTNNYNSYAAITARNLNAKYSCIARGGIGIMVSWFDMIMPEMYNRLNPADKNSLWDFSKEEPNIVVINLFQNDSWIVNNPNNDEFKRRFGSKKPNAKQIKKHYINFIKKIRKEYNKAAIVCLLGNMDITKEGSPWPNYVLDAVSELKDNNIYTCTVPYKNTKGHPKVIEHQKIAFALTKLIKNQIINKY